MLKTYKIHDNGGRPFKVVIYKNNVLVFRRHKRKDKYESDPILAYDAERIFVGTSPLNKMTEFSGGHGPKFDGNSILLHINENLYVSIGWEIFSFRSCQKIVEYVSPVGNSNVPYPYAIDEDKNYYLLIEDVVLKNNGNLESQIKNCDYDPYTYYYQYKPINEPKIFIGDKEYHWRYHPFPAENYDWYRKRGLVYSVNLDGTKKELTKEMYTELVESFGLENFFAPIKDKIILQKRL
ncbi:MAG: DNA ligase [Satyrvirus sp.]|uniref:DNA ligase n=1 Tax=Satyrvirus sp. TaxID=2487771 RepID=A0A3G5ADT6_9VIRU|nr:MAG: DNA ligase [Satyrvirus sp.]